MAMYIGLIQFTEQGIRNIKDTVKRGEAAIAEAEAIFHKWELDFAVIGDDDEFPIGKSVQNFLDRIGHLRVSLFSSEH